MIEKSDLESQKPPNFISDKDHKLTISELLEPEDNEESGSDDNFSQYMQE